MTKKLILAALASSLFFACGGSGDDDPECTLDEAAACAGKQCGSLQVQDSCGATHTITCGTCSGADEICQNNMCIPDQPPVCEVSEADKAKACAGKCGTVQTLDSCNNMVDVNCGADACTGGTVCKPSANACVPESECELKDADIDNACGEFGCGPTEATDLCGRKTVIDCGCDGSGFSDKDGVMIPAEEMHCVWGEWYHISQFSQAYCGQTYKLADGSVAKACGDMNLGLDSCDQPVAFTCPESNCNEEGMACVQSLCVKTGVCSDSRDVLTDWIGTQTCEADLDETCSDKCGTVVDACGKSQECGGCGPDEMCNPATNRCGLNPDACTKEFACKEKCGVVTDSCGNTHDCGTSNCGPGASCNYVNHMCETAGEPAPDAEANEIKVTNSTGYALINKDGLFGVYYNIKENTSTAYNVDQLLVGVNGLSGSSKDVATPSIIGKALDLSTSDLGQDSHYDWTCNSDEACFGVYHRDITCATPQCTTLSKNVNEIFEAKSGTLTLSKASLEGGIAGEVSEATMFTWVLTSSVDSCDVPSVGFSFDFPATDASNKRVVFDATCDDDAMETINGLDGKSIDGAQATVGAKNLLVEADTDAGLFIFGVNAYKKLATFTEFEAEESYIDLDDEAGSVFCDAEAESAKAPGVCAGFWSYQIDEGTMMLDTLYDMYYGVVTLSNITDKVEGSIEDAIFQPQDVNGLCGLSDPISFSFSADISK